jgi:hypothetical protein
METSLLFAFRVERVSEGRGKKNDKLKKGVVVPRNERDIKKKNAVVPSPSNSQIFLH